MVNYSRSVAVPLAVGPCVLAVIAVSLRRDANSRRLLAVFGCLILLGCCVRDTPRRPPKLVRRFSAQSGSGPPTRDLRPRLTYTGTCSEMERSWESTASMEPATRVGDPFAPLIAWHRLGFLGMIVFTLIAIAVPSGGSGAQRSIHEETRTDRTGRHPHDRLFNLLCSARCERPLFQPRHAAPVGRVALDGSRSRRCA